MPSLKNINLIQLFSIYLSASIVYLIKPQTYQTNQLQRYTQWNQGPIYTSKFYSST